MGLSGAIITLTTFNELNTALSLSTSYDLNFVTSVAHFVIRWCRNTHEQLPSSATRTSSFSSSKFTDSAVFFFSFFLSFNYNYYFYFIPLTKMRKKHTSQ